MVGVETIKINIMFHHESEHASKKDLITLSVISAIIILVIIHKIYHGC